MAERRVIFFVEGEPHRGLSPASRMRAYQYAQLFAGAGWTCDFFPSHPPKYFHNRYWMKRLRVHARWIYRVALACGWGVMCGVRLWQIRRVRPGDVVVLQREFLPNSATFLERRLAGRARRLVFDFDDAILEQDPRKTELILRLAQSVIVSTPQLRADAVRFNPSVHLVPTPVDTDAIQPRRRDATTPVIGWMGTSGNLRYLKPLEETFRRLATAHSFRFRIVSNRAYASEYPDLPAEIAEWALETEAAELQGFDIGIMPLRDDPWCRGKAGFKLLQYMAAGLPVVASPVGINCELVRPGVNGFLADSPAEWETHLTHLLEDQALRVRLGQAGRAFVEREFSVRTSFTKLMEALH